MKMIFDTQGILSSQDISAPEGKTYNYRLGNFLMTSKDKLLTIYNKRQRKLIQLKDFSEGMQICYGKSQILPDLELEKKMLTKSLAIFNGFNEETGEKYFFLPYFNKDTQVLESQLAQLGISCKINKKTQGTFIHGLNETFQMPSNDTEIMSFLFALILIYGKLEKKWSEVMSFKVHLPLFGRYKTLFEEITVMIEDWQANGYFLNAQLVTHGEKAILQLSSNDGEILTHITKFMNYLKEYQASPLQLSLYQKKQTEIKNQLLDFLKNQFIIEEVEETIRQIEGGTLLKFLKY